MLIPILLFSLGLIVLIKGGDWFVDGATGIARRLSIPDLLIGATVVSIGTTLPEVMVSATSAVAGHGELAYGNAIGSIICNTALIAAISITVAPSVVNKKTLYLPVTFLFGFAAFYATIAYTQGFFSRIVGVVLLLGFVLYMILNAIQMKKIAHAMEGITELDEDEPEPKQVHPVPLWHNILFLVLGAALIAWGADLLVDNGILIAQSLGVPESVIALTFIALGTSLPELVTAITALAKKHGALSVGNVIGANLFNLVFVSGLAVTLSPFKIPQSATIGSVNMSLAVDIPVMLAVSLIMIVPTLIRGKFARWQGISLLSIYTAFILVQFIGA